MTKGFVAFFLYIIYLSYFIRHIISAHKKKRSESRAEGGWKVRERIVGGRTRWWRRKGGLQSTAGASITSPPLVGYIGNNHGGCWELWGSTTAQVFALSHLQGTSRTESLKTRTGRQSAVSAGSPWIPAGGKQAVLLLCSKSKDWRRRRWWWQQQH